MPTELPAAGLNRLTERIIGMCIEVHRELGPGLLESAYEAAMDFELRLAGLTYERQREVPLRYKQMLLPVGYRLDFVLEHQLLLELKSVTELLPIHRAQVLTYLRLERLPLGLLINFNVSVLKNGIERIVNGRLV